MLTVGATWRLLSVLVFMIFIGMMGIVSASDSDCPQALNMGPTYQSKTFVNLYVEGNLKMRSKSQKKDSNNFVSPEEELINRCSRRLTANTFSDSLPERLNIFADQSKESRSGAFISVSSVDQKMAMEKKGPYWHVYVTAFPDLRFVGATIRLAHGLITLDNAIQSIKDLTGKRVGLVMRPSSLRALQEIVLINAWDIYDQIRVQEYSPDDMSDALDQGEVDIVFMPVIREVNGKLLPIHLDINRSDIHWISLSTQDVIAATKNTPVLAERIVLPLSATSADNYEEVGLITFDVAWFTFASTPDDVVYDFLQAARHVCSPKQPNCPGLSVERLLRWPQLETRLIHPGAQRFYKEQGAISYP